MDDFEIKGLVLLVEDDEALLRGMQAWLRDNRYGYAVMAAADAHQALEEIDRYRPDLVVSDLRLPGMDGFQLLLACRRRYPGVRFVFMSAFGTPEVESRSLRYGAVSFLRKPFDMVQLETLVAEALRQPPGEQRAGYLRGVSVPGFIQLLAMERKSVVLHLHNPLGREGVLFLSQGELVHAERGELSGVQAAMELLGWDEAELRMDDARSAPSRTIHQKLPVLIMEAMRRKDERARRLDV